MNPAVGIGTTWMGGALIRQKRGLCLPHEAAERLGISVDEVLAVISTGELSAVKFMADDRWFVHVDSLDKMVRQGRRLDTRPDRSVPGPGLVQLFRRCLDAIL